MSRTPGGDVPHRGSTGGGGGGPQGVSGQRGPVEAPGCPPGRAPGPAARSRAPGPALPRPTPHRPHSPPPRASPAGGGRGGAAWGTCVHGGGGGAGAVRAAPGGAGVPAGPVPRHRRPRPPRPPHPLGPPRRPPWRPGAPLLPLGCACRPARSVARARRRRGDCFWRIVCRCGSAWRWSRRRSTARGAWASSTRP